MKKLVQKATIIDPNSPYNGQVKDILFENGKIISIEDNISEDADEVISSERLHICPGLFELRAQFSEPGFEQHETIQSGLEAAKAGGYTEVCMMPNTKPVIDNASMVNYAQNMAKGHDVQLHPIGAMSQKMEGKELSEMFDMKTNGAIAFSDHNHPVENPNLLTRAMLYSQSFDGLVMSFPMEKSMAFKGQVNEGVVGTNMGVPGIPNLSEELSVSRDLFLANYNDTQLHLGPISAENSVSMIAEAKSENLKVSCDVAIHNLILTDEACSDFDSNTKVLPPLRTQEDVDALIEGLKSGAIDIISSDHQPWDVEEKVKEFDHAQFGIIGLESTFALALTHLKEHIGLEGIVTKLAINPRTVLKRDLPIVKEGFEANFTLFDPELTWELSKEDLKSKSHNSPFLNTPLKGKAIGIITS